MRKNEYKGQNYNPNHQNNRNNNSSGNKYNFCHKTGSFVDLAIFCKIGNNFFSIILFYFIAMLKISVNKHAENFSERDT
jgi:hypothetical protein